MKHLILILAVSFFGVKVFSQSFTRSCSEIKGKTEELHRFTDEDSLIITFFSTDKKTLQNLLNHSFLEKATLNSIGIELAKSLGSDKKIDDLIIKAGPPKPKGTLTIKLDLTDHRPGNTDSMTLIFSCDGVKKDIIPLKKDTTKSKKEEVHDKGPVDPSIPFKPVSFISAEMMKLIREGSICNLCDTNVRQPVLISKRRDRKYATNYIILYDPMLTKDAYTICKHIFRKRGNQLEERYKKVGNKWFAAAVGSQIRFEVVNQPLTDSRRITVDAVDIFNTGSSQFQGIINSQVNANLINRLNQPTEEPAGKVKPSTEQILKKDTSREATDEEKLKMLNDQLVDYVSVFRVSSCTIDQHFRNLPVIIASINKIFGTTAAGVLDLIGQLKNKFVKSDELKAKVDEIGSLLTLLKDIKPLAYTTLRAKNRDYLVVKTFDTNNTEIGSENIRMSGGLKIDFSAGFVLTGLRDYSYILKDTSVRYQPNRDDPALSDTSGNIIIKENIGKRQVGVGILTHIYPRISSDYNLGVTVGLMSSTELDLRFMLGGSLMLSSLFGSNNRVSFSGGAVWGKVKRLSNAYYEGYKVINNKPVFYDATTPVSTVTVPVTEHSWFFAVTMNFGGN